MQGQGAKSNGIRGDLLDRIVREGLTEKVRSEQA